MDELRIASNWLNESNININSDKQENNTMNNWVRDNIKFTKDAVLVQRYFGTSLEYKLDQFLLKDKVQELIEEAHRLEKEANKKNK